MHILNYLFAVTSLLGLTMSLNADTYSQPRNVQSEQRQLDNNRQERIIQDNKIQENKLEEQRLDNNREEQHIIDKQLEQRRLDNKRYDNARGRNIVASRDRRDNDIERNDLVDDALNERFLENAVNGEQQLAYPENQQPKLQGQAPGACSNCQDKQIPGACFNCQDKQALILLETNEKHHEENYQHRKALVEQWGRDHPRD